VDASGRVRPDGVGGDAEKEQKFQSKPQSPATETAVARRAHERSVGGREGKTTSARDTKMGETGVLVRKSKYAKGGIIRFNTETSIWVS
jgi:hypothetical protein